MSDHVRLRHATARQYESSKSAKFRVAGNYHFHRIFTILYNQHHQPHPDAADTALVGSIGRVIMSRFDCFIYGGFGAVIVLLIALVATPIGIMWG